MYGYPVTLEPDDNGTILVRAPDIPELVTFGSSKSEALEQARRALVIALESYQDSRRDLPKASEPEGRPIISPPPRVALKAALYQGMRDLEVTNVQLAARLGCDEKQVRRLLDFSVDSRISEIARALDAVGLELVTKHRAA